MLPKRYTQRASITFTMKRTGLFLLTTNVLFVSALNLTYLDPTKLQTKTSSTVQRDTALQIIQKYTSKVTVEVKPIIFRDNKDVFVIRTLDDVLHIRASSGVAAVWGFHYYLKKYCESHIGWQVRNVNIPDPLPQADEVVVANDRFRYYENVCTASYSFVWWDVEKWTDHVEWMAMNGINLALAPVAQEAAWAKIYKNIGMTDHEIDEHFTGPAFLSWLRMGNLRGWGGPLLQSWHDRQKNIQDAVVDLMFKLGMVPVIPAFSGHVPRAFERIYPNTTFFPVGKWNKFSSDYCCGLFLNPGDELFKTIGSMFLREVMESSTIISNVYSADPFNEIKVEPWSTELAKATANSIYSTINEIDKNGVWLLQNWMFAHDPLLWPLKRVQTFLTTIPNGRLLILDLQSEQWPQYNLYKMYYGHAFIWCMLHNFGGTLGMFGNIEVINREVYDVRSRAQSTMIGIGLTPEGINQNYVVYDLMLESAWRKEPIKSLDDWAGEYAERRYGCNQTAAAWRYLLKSVYSFKGFTKMRGKYVVTRRPSFKIHPWAWYKSYDLFEAFKLLTLSSDKCNSVGFNHDLVDVTRQALQYRVGQLYMNILKNRFSSTWVFNSTISQFLDAMSDIEQILATNSDFSLMDWLNNARNIAANEEQKNFYELNARNQITLWGPNGEITDYACKQWTELFHYYYIPRWRTFLMAALEALQRNEPFDEKRTQNIVRSSVEEQFMSVEIVNQGSSNSPSEVAGKLYEKWSNVPGLDDLPLITNGADEDDVEKSLVDSTSEENSSSSIPVAMFYTGW